MAAPSNNAMFILKRVLQEDTCTAGIHSAGVLHHVIRAGTRDVPQPHAEHYASLTAPC